MYTSSGSRSRYSEPLQAKEVEKEKKSEEPSRIQPRRLKGNQKRNFWIDYPDEEFLPSHNPGGLAGVTKFEIKFPRHRELYLKQNEENIKSELGKKFLAFRVNFKDGECIITTGPKTFDPFIVVKGKLMVQCIARGVPLEKAKDILQDKVFCDVIHIKNLCKNDKIFQKRRSRLFGPNGSTLKAIELLTKTFVVIMGGTVTVVGDIKDCREVRKIVEGCMMNEHPIYRIKELMIINQYKKDPKMKNENWSKYLPKFKKKSRRSRKKNVPKYNRKRSFHIPLGQPRKIDEKLASGEYFLKEKERKEKFQQKRNKRNFENRKKPSNFRRRNDYSNNSFQERVSNIRRGNQKKRKRVEKSASEYIEKRPTKRRKKS